MCAVYGFLDYGKKVSHSTLKRLLRDLSVEAECRGTDATGISYVNNGKIVTYKKASPASKTRLFFPADTTCVIGHDRMTTQGSENKSYNNHPFEGKADKCFALAHNGIIYNDHRLRYKNKLPETNIETDSYIAVQLLEQAGSVDFNSIKNMAETVSGSFVFTILCEDNILFLVKGENPITIYNYPELGIYVYASTEYILNNALKSAKIKGKHNEVIIETGDIVAITPDGKAYADSFEMKEPYTSMYYCDRWSGISGDCEDELLSLCGWFGIDEEDIEFLRSCGYDDWDIEELLYDTDCFEKTVRELKGDLKGGEKIEKKFKS